MTEIKFFCSGFGCFCGMKAYWLAWMILAVALAAGCDKIPSNFATPTKISTVSAGIVIDELRAKAESDNADAQCNLGILLLKDPATGLPWPVSREDKTEAEKWLKLAATAGNPRAMIELAELINRNAYDNAVTRGEISAKTDLAMGLRLPKYYVPDDYYYWYRKAAELGNLEAMQILVNLLFDSDNPSNRNQGVLWLKKLVETGDTDAMVTLGYRYMNGADGQTNLDEAIRLCEKAAESQGIVSKDSDAYRALGAMYWGKKEFYQEIRCLESDIKKYETVTNNVSDKTCSILNDKKNAKDIIASAELHLGRIYSNTNFGGYDYKQSFKWFLKAAEDAEDEPYSAFEDEPYFVVMRQLGEMNENGQGVTQNDAEALKWYKIGAHLGDFEAAFRVATFYQQGRGVGQDFQKALQYYQLAADKGDLLASNICYQAALARGSTPTHNASVGTSVAENEKVSVSSVSAKIVESDSSYDTWSWQATFENKTDASVTVFADIQFLDKQGFTLESTPVGHFKLSHYEKKTISYTEMTKHSVTLQMDHIGVHLHD